MNTARMNRGLTGCLSAEFSQAKAKRDYQAWVHSDQMVLAIVRRKAGSVAWWPKALKLELENNSREGKGPNQKQAEWQPKIKVDLYFLMVRWRMEILYIVDGDGRWEPISLPQVCATVIQGTEE